MRRQMCLHPHHKQLTMKRLIASSCPLKTITFFVISVVLVVIFLLILNNIDTDILLNVPPQHNVKPIEYITNRNKKPTEGNAVKIGLINITIAKNIHDTSVEDLAQLYEDARGLYMDGVDYFLVVNDGTGAPSKNIQQSLIKELQRSSYPPDVGLSISIKNGISIIFHRSHFDIFGNIFPKQSIPRKKAFNWLFNIYHGKIYSHSKEQSMNDTQIKIAAGSEAAHIKEGRDLLEKYIKVFKKTNAIVPIGTKVISMSLYGSNPRYTQGAIRNAQLARIHFPEWVLRFYVPSQNDSKKYVVPGKVLQKLSNLQAEVKFVNQELSSAIPPMMLRFLVADDPDVDIFLVQDCDSRLSERISIPVALWLNSSNAPFYCIRDHPAHSRFAISGGLWGARRKAFMILLNNTFTHFIQQGFKDKYLQDMAFLNNDVWPLVKSSVFCHDSFSCTKYPGSHPFPVVRRGQEHAGQVFDQFDIGRLVDINVLRRAKLKFQCIP